jgi:hypothetical protein
MSSVYALKPRNTVALYYNGPFFQVYSFHEIYKEILFS